MKNSSNKFIKTLSCIAIIVGMAFTTSASALGNSTPPDGPGNTQDNDENSIPLDGGLSILIAGAAAFGIKKLRGKKEAV